MRHRPLLMAVSLFVCSYLSFNELTQAAGPLTLGPAPVPHLPLKKLEVNLDKATPLPLPTPKFELKATVFQTPDHKDGWVIRIPGNRPIATPAYADGMIFVGGGYGSYEFYAFDATTGKLVWKFHTNDDGPTAAVVEDGFCVFNTESCTVYVLDAKTGKLVWQQWLGDPLMSQPAVANGRLYIAYPGGGPRHPVQNQAPAANQKLHGQSINSAPMSPPGHRLLCADLKTGEHLWDQPISADVISAPIVDGGKVYLTCFDGTSFCFNGKDGSVLWKEAHAATSAPTIADGQIIVTRRENKGNEAYEVAELASLPPAGALPVAKPLGEPVKAPYLKDGNAVAWSAAKQTSLDAMVGFSAPPPMAELEKAKSNVGINTVAGAWAYQGSRPVVKGDTVLRAQAQDIRATDKRGNETWHANFSGKTVAKNNQLFAPPSLGKANMYLTSADGHIVSMSQKTGSVNFIYATNEPMNFQPALAQGNIYAGTSNGLLLCLPSGSKDADGWSGWGGNAQHNKKD